MQQFYLNSQILSDGHRKNVRAISIDNQPMICLANSNKLELYRYAAKGITYYRNYSFFADISHLQILPNKHQPFDYVFLLDQKGRYGFWSPLGGFQLIQNASSQNPQQNNLFKTNEREGQDCSFCSQSHRFQVLDTKGWVCFNLRHSAIVVEYSITNRGLVVEKRREVPFQLIKYRYITCMSHPKYHKLLGVIQQNEEKTIFKVFNIEKISKITTTNHIEQFQKINLLEVLPASNHQVLILSSNELLLATNYPFAVIARFTIHDTHGRLVNLGEHLYGYIGKQLILVDGSKIKNYGSFTLEGINILKDKGVCEVSYLRKLQDGGKLISIATKYHELFFIILYQNTWKLCKKITSLSPVYSINETDKQNCYVAVTNTADNTYAVSVVQREMVAKIQKEEDYPFFVEKMFCLRGGQTLLVCSKESNNLLNYNNTTKGYEAWAQCESLPGEVIKANDFFYVMTTGIFAWNESGTGLVRIIEDKIQLVELKDNYAIYLSYESKEVKEITLSSSEIRVVRSAAHQEYAWALLRDYTLVVARSDQLNQLIRYKGSEIVQNISIEDHGIISEMIELTSEEGVIAIGYITGVIKLSDLKQQISQIITCFDNEVVHFFGVGPDKLGVSMGTKQYLLSKQQKYRIQQVRISYSYSSIHAICYSPINNSLIFFETSTQNKFLITADFSSINRTLQTPIPDTSYRITNLFEMREDIPTVYAKGSLVFIAVTEKLVIMNLATKQVVKEIPNYFKDVIGIQSVQSGILVYGIDQLNRNILSLLSLEELQVIASVNLILKENKYVKSIKVLPNSKNITFVCRSQKYTTVYELTDTYQPNQLQEIKADYMGYSLDIDPNYHLFALTDSYRFIAAYSYQQDIIPVARFVNPSEINDFTMLSKSVMLGDKAGYITILEYNVENPHDALKMIMTKVAAMKVAQQVSTITKTTSSTALYGTFGGKIGKITIIDEITFRQFKSIEEKVLADSKYKSEFEYKGWRDRDYCEDKMVDSSLIELYVKRQGEETRQDGEYKQILYLFKRFCL